MADISKFVAPAWLDDQDAETIHERMMSNLPDDIDDTEGGFPWDFTKPTALEKAELLEFEMMEAVKTMHYMFAYGIYLDYHAKAYDITRKSAVPASGTLTITGSQGTVIPEGFLFAVPASGNEAAITFCTEEEVVIDLDGNAEVSAYAQEAGTIGNVAADTIVIMAQPITGIESVTNRKKFTGGAPEESDDELRERIREYLENSDISYVGCDADYIRWAKEVDDVGDAILIPEWDGPGTVKLIVLNRDGEPASPYIVGNVYNHIVSPDDRSKRLAPIGATVTVVAPSNKYINVDCKITFENGSDEEAVTGQISTLIDAYFRGASKEIKRNFVGSIIMSVDGVNDYSDLTIGYRTTNIAVSKDEYPMLGAFIVNGEVVYNGV